MTRRFHFFGVGAMLGGLLLSGCTAPNKVNIELRKQNQELQSQIADLQRLRDADRATIAGLHGHTFDGPVLPAEQLARLFTATGLQFGDLTGGYHPDPDKPGDTMLKVYVVPIDEQGEPLKSAGTFHIELFDLALSTNNRLGQWDFDLPTAKSDWLGRAFMYTYALSCPWQTAPTHSKLVARVTFTDELTHRVFTVDRDVTVQLPP